MWSSKTTLATIYTDLDFEVQTDADILAKGHADSVPDVTFNDTEVLAVQDNGAGGIQHLQVMQNHYRFRCPRLPRFESIRIVLAISAKDSDKAKSVRVYGQYRGKFRVRGVGSRTAPKKLNFGADETIK